MADSPGSPGAGGAAFPEGGLPEGGLHCLGGRPAPPDARFDLAEIGLLPEAARAAFYGILEAVLPATPIADLDARMARFAEDHQTPPARVARAARICRLLLREAARRGVSREGFVADLRALSAPGDDAAEQVLAPIFDRAMLALRQELQYSSLLGHGLLLTDVDWRLDVMKHSKRGADLDTPVVMLTLHYAEGLKRERITLQVLPDMLGELQTMCRHVLD